MKTKKQAPKEAFWYPKTSHRELGVPFTTPVPFYYPLDLLELTALLRLANTGYTPGKIFFWRLVPAITGMTSPTPLNGPVYEKYLKLYQVFQNEVVHKFRADYTSIAEKMLDLMQ